MSNVENSSISAIADLLKYLANKELSQEEEAFVLNQINGIVSTLNNRSIDPKDSFESNDNDVSVPDAGKEGSCVETSNDEAKDDSTSSLSSELLDRVNDVRIGFFPPKPITVKLKRLIEDEVPDTTKCLGHILNADMWNGELGWHTTDDFYSMACYLWVHSKEMFVKLDPDREILEDKSKWNQSYFEKQRNYLRHNFSLERLVHEIMVYDYLHGVQAREASARIPPKGVVKKSRPFVDDSANNTASPHDSQSQIKRIWLCGGLLFVAIILFLILFLFCRKSADKKDTPIPNNQKQETTIQTHSDLPQQTNNEKNSETNHQNKDSLAEPTPHAVSAESNSEPIESEGNSI